MSRDVTVQVMGLTGWPCSGCEKPLTTFVQNADGRFCPTCYRKRYTQSPMTCIHCGHTFDRYPTAPSSLAIELNYTYSKPGRTIDARKFFCSWTCLYNYALARAAISAYAGKEKP